MKRVLFLALTVSVVIAFAQPGFAQFRKIAGNSAPAAGGIKVEAEEGTATVDSIDYENRTGTLKLPDGTMLTFRVSPEVRNSDQVKVGDKVLIRK